MNVEGTNKVVTCLVEGTGQRVSEGERKLCREYFLCFLSFELCECIAYSEFLNYIRVESFDIHCRTLAGDCSDSAQATWTHALDSRSPCSRRQWTFLKVKARKGKTADSASFKEITNWLEKISHCGCAHRILKLLPDNPLVIGNSGDLGHMTQPSWDLAFQSVIIMMKTHCFTICQLFLNTLFYLAFKTTLGADTTVPSLLFGWGSYGSERVGGWGRITQLWDV